jgi:hypothetical protein
MFTPMNILYLVGDDLLLFIEIYQRGMFTDGLFGILLNSDQNKWRPVFETLLYFASQSAEQNFAIVVTVLIILLFLIYIAIVYLILRQVLYSYFLTFIIITLVILSAFNWYIYSQLHGLMEIMGLVFMSGTVLSSINFIKKNSILYLYLSMFLVTLATYTHERYALSFVVPLYLGLVRKVHFKHGFAFFLIISQVFLLRYLSAPTNFFTPGGESGIAEYQIYWILRNILISIASVFGFGFGFDSSNLFIFEFTGNQLGINADILVSASLALFISLVVLRKGVLYKFLKTKDSFTEQKILLSAFILMILSNIIPASLTVERIEPRWLALPSLVTIFMLIYVYNFSKKRGKFLSTFFLINILLVNLFTTTKYYTPKNIHLNQRNLVSNFMKILNEHNSTMYGNNVLIVTSNFISSDWLFAYGGFFDLYSSKFQTVILQTKGLPVRDLYKWYYPGNKFMYVFSKNQLKYNGYFDSYWYLSEYPDVKNSGMDALFHFEMFGIYEGRFPNATEANNLSFDKVREYMITKSYNCFTINLDFDKQHVSKLLQTPCPVLN